MASAAITRLPPVKASPTTLQYLEYKRKTSRPSPYYKPRFTFKTKDREKTLLQPWMRKTDPLMPPYPYGKNHTFKEANFGLYGGSTIQSGNKISKGKNKGKTLRHWFPNVRIAKIWSEALHTELKIPVTSRVLRTIRKCGGVDQYVCGTKPARIKELGLLGWKLRWLVMTSPKYRKQYAEEQQKFGLPREALLQSSFEDAWNNGEMRAKFIQQQDEAWQHLREAAARFEKHVQEKWVESGEKRTYKIPKLETLARRSPSTLELPDHLEQGETDEVAGTKKR
ncbi:uncharacterized protein Z518_04315 [Rhinocladiella mackenziei CBS 650.93]|uniref:54S ribosomal protein L24, mitochondrial n=1 Tax=Rhinocladiella mackenziei CBS 650.93 TaxID=1442369 RepID=A0A0D2IKV9_9EURO|nr:uncharacterized protein Z518_04315 [Rhinocladiella mackenziei CBS 650.93]KIX06339.1 hypothetical protein Z518_04315 [Rhinocladiella mackenziei CBS 650.93]